MYKLRGCPYYPLHLCQYNLDGSRCSFRFTEDECKLLPPADSREEYIVYELPKDQIFSKERQKDDIIKLIEECTTNREDSIIVNVSILKRRLLERGEDPEIVNRISVNDVEKILNTFYKR